MVGGGGPGYALLSSNSLQEIAYRWPNQRFESVGWWTCVLGGG